MARVEAAIYSILAANANVTGIVSTRIYPTFLPQNCALPALTYFRVSSMREGAFMADPGFSIVRIQISAWATSALDAGNLADKVRSAIHRYTGTIGGVLIEDAAIEGEATLYEPETETHEVAIDFMVAHQEAT